MTMAAAIICRCTARRADTAGWADDDVADEAID